MQAEHAYCADQLRSLLLHGSRLRSVPRPQVYGMAGLGRSGVDGQGRAPGSSA